MQIVDINDPDMRIVGVDVGGGEIYHYKGTPFTGVVEERFPNGNLLLETQCLNGYPDGFVRGYFDNGQLMQEAFIKYNLDYGLMKEWDEGGNLTDEYYWGPEPNFNGIHRKMILAIDVYYLEDSAKAVGALFKWDDTVAADVISVQVDNIEPYVPGEFYKRELPCILKVIEQAGVDQIDIVIVDGNVYIDNEGTYGLGGKLFEALGGNIPVIGVAKTSFKNTEQKVIPVERGQSKNPLFVSAIGMDTEEAAALIKGMKGEHRMPDILKHVDTLTKQA